MATLLLPVAPRINKIYKPRAEIRVEDYRSLFRFNEDNVQWIADHFLGKNTETRGGALTPEIKMQIFLRYVADPGFQVGVAQDMGVDQTTLNELNELSLKDALAKLNEDSLHFITKLEFN
jgi:hypothetical protein